MATLYYVRGFSEIYLLSLPKSSTLLSSVAMHARTRAAIGYRTDRAKENVPLVRVREKGTGRSLQRTKLNGCVIFTVQARACGYWRVATMGSWGLIDRVFAGASVGRV
jgi:hypothetical protein